MMQSLVDFADQSAAWVGGYSANVETGIMQGDPTSILIACRMPLGRMTLMFHELSIT